MRIELYKILSDPNGFDLGKRIQTIVQASLEKRNRKHNLELLRLEAFEKRGPLWLCDFVKIRTHHGPAKAGIGEPVKGFGLKKDQGFGEETAFLWNSTNNWCVVQYNHHGVRPSSIAAYLGEYVHDEHVLLELAPKLDDKIHAKIRSKKVVNKFTLTVAPKALSNHDFDVGAGLGEAARALKQQSDADRIEITITAKRGRSLDLSLTELASWIGRLAGHTQSAAGANATSPIKTARATARDTTHDTPEVLDLLHHRITTEEALSPGSDKRIPVKARWDAVNRAHDSWKHLMKG